jgi:hypothetical protein
VDAEALLRVVDADTSFRAATRTSPGPTSDLLSAARTRQPPLPTSHWSSGAAMRAEQDARRRRTGCASEHEGGLGRVGLGHFLQAAEKAKEQPYKAVIKNDQAWLSSLLDHLPDLINGVAEAYEGITVEAFEQLEVDA